MKFAMSLKQAISHKLLCFQWYLSTQACNNKPHHVALGKYKANKYRVNIDSVGDGWLAIGFHTGYGVNERAWYLHASGSKMRSAVGDTNLINNEEYYHEFEPLAAGDVITATHNGPTISFEKNGFPMGVAFTDAPLEGLFPAVDLGAGGGQVTIIA